MASAHRWLDPKPHSLPELNAVVEISEVDLCSDLTAMADIWAESERNIPESSCVLTEQA